MSQRPSAKKSFRRSERHRLANKPVKSRLTTEKRKFERALDRGDLPAARTQLDLLTKLLHQAAAKGVIHAGNAARRQQRLHARLNKAASGAK